MCVCVCYKRTLIPTNADAVVENEVFVRELAHHAGCFKEGLVEERGFC